MSKTAYVESVDDPNVLSFVCAYIRMDGRFWLIEIPYFGGITQARFRDEIITVAVDYVRTMLDRPDLPAIIRYTDEPNCIDIGVPSDVLAEWSRKHPPTSFKIVEEKEDDDE